MEKVKVTKAQADAFEEIIGVGDDMSHQVQLHAKYPDNWRSNSELNGMPLDTFIRALYIGYEVELSPEEKVREMYCKAADEEKDLYNHPQASWWRSRRRAIFDTVNALGIKIEGVNA